MIPPWAYGPFELIAHAEDHLRKGEDFDRRMALISFDNAIEVAVSSYLALHPKQRQDRDFPQKCVTEWLKNYHNKLDFLEIHLKDLGVPWEVPRTEVILVHDHRNEHYHSATRGVPEKRVIELARKSALWVFSLLFGVGDIEAELNRYLEFGEVELGAPSELATSLSGQPTTKANIR